MSYAVVRQQLDALFGPGARNASIGSSSNPLQKPKERSFEDPDVCRAYLAGLCPHDLFTNTRVDMGPCAKIHSPVLKEKYELAKKERKDGRDVWGCERDLLWQLQRIEDDCDRRIARGMRRLTETGELAPDVPDRLQQIQAAAAAGASDEITELVARAEKEGEMGNVDESMRLYAQAEELKAQFTSEQQADALLASIQGGDGGAVGAVGGSAGAGGGGGSHQKLRVCPTCGGYLSVFDSDRRLADHFGGKMHVGFGIIRKVVRGLKEKFERDPTASTDRWAERAAFAAAEAGAGGSARGWEERRGGRGGGHFGGGGGRRGRDEGGSSGGGRWQHDRYHERYGGGRGGNGRPTTRSRSNSREREFAPPASYGNPTYGRR